MCMATKTISLKLAAYERLRRARREPGESFSDVVMRAEWPDMTARGGELLALIRERGPDYAPPDLDAIEAVKASDQAPADKWTEQ